MGVNTNALRFLARASKNGVNFARSAMIGRQGIHVELKMFQRILLDEFQFDWSPEQLANVHGTDYAEDLFKLFGAQTVDSFDYSDYEGATHVHDFNTPIPNEFKSRYSLLIDGGTLEHVFNFPVALKNCMEMLEVGGSYVGVSPANNEMGHGFYQVSPELYFRAFSETNGFKTDLMVLYEGRESKKWLKIADPEIVKRRAQRLNNKSTYLLVLATRIADKEIFAQPLFQPDYVSAWNRSTTDTDFENTSPAEKTLIRRLASRLPYGVKRSITMQRVRFQERLKRIGVAAGWNCDKEVFTSFDPVND